MSTFDSFKVRPKVPMPESSDGSYLISIDLTSPEATSISPQGVRTKQTTILPEDIILSGPLSVETIEITEDEEGYAAGKYYSDNGMNGLSILHGESDTDEAEVEETQQRISYKTTTAVAKELMEALDKHVEKSGGRRRKRRQTRRTRKVKTSRRRKTRARRVRN